MSLSKEQMDEAIKKVTEKLEEARAAVACRMACGRKNIAPVTAEEQASLGTGGRQCLKLVKH